MVRLIFQAKKLWLCTIHTHLEVQFSLCCYLRWCCYTRDQYVCRFFGQLQQSPDYHYRLQHDQNYRFHAPPQSLPALDLRMPCKSLTCLTKLRHVQGHQPATLLEKNDKQIIYAHQSAKVSWMIFQPIHAVLTCCALFLIYFFFPLLWSFYLT